MLLPILGALPDCLIIVASGMGPRAEAKGQVKVGLGTLAGSTVMLLTIAWGGSVLLGRCDLEKRRDQLVAKDKKLTKPRDVVETGVTVDRPTQVNAMIMTLSVLLYLIVHIPALAGMTKDPKEYPSHSIPSIVGFVCCMIALAVYIAFQVVYPERRRRVLSRLRRRAMRDKALHHLAKLSKARSLGNLVGRNGELDVTAARGLFHRFDLDGSGRIDRRELRNMLMGMAVTMPNSVIEEGIETWMGDLNKDDSSGISEEHFFSGLRRMLSEKKASFRKRQQGTVSDEEANRLLSMAISATPRTRLLHEYEEEEDDDDDEDEEDEPRTKTQTIVEACMKLALGTLIAALFADPMVGTVSSFAKASHIPPFFVAFVATPLASKASELVSLMSFAMKKKKKNMNLTFSQVYGMVTMNNTMCLGLFLLVVFVQDLPWDYTAEVTAIVIPTIIVGYVGSSATTFRTYVALLVLLLYIVGIGIVLIFQKWFPDID
eukprot:evm.model.scf_1988.1 EVM.evm.TU.scf_1988.1   scf_1988:1312-9743(+)